MKTPHPTHDCTTSKVSAPSSRLALFKRNSSTLLRALPVNRTILAAVSCLAMVSFSAPKADAQTLLTGGFNGDFNFATNWVNGAVGAQITVGASDLSVTSLGFGDFGQDGFVVAHTVELWTTGGTSLGSVTLSAGTGDPLTDEWRFATLGTPITLSAGTTYVIGASTNTDDGDPWFGSGLAGIQPDFVYSTDFTGTPVGRINNGGTFVMPTDDPGVQIYSLNLGYTVVPEPSTVGLMILAGTFGMVFRRRLTPRCSR